MFEMLVITAVLLAPVAGFEDANAEGVIVFCKGAFCFKWKSKTFLFHHIAENIAGQIDNHDMVVVGNIHEVEE